MIPAAFALRLILFFTIFYNPIDSVEKICYSKKWLHFGSVLRFESHEIIARTAPNAWHVCGCTWDFWSAKDLDLSSGKLPEIRDYASQIDNCLFPECEYGKICFSVYSGLKHELETTFSCKPRGHVKGKKILEVMYYLGKRCW